MAEYGSTSPQNPSGANTEAEISSEVTKIESRNQCNMLFFNVHEVTFDFDIQRAAPETPERLVTFEAFYQ